MTVPIAVGIYPYMAFMDYIWLIKLIIELLKVLSGFEKEELQQVAKGINNLRDITSA